MATVTKKDLVAAVSAKSGINQTVAADVINQLVDVIVEKLSDGEEVTLRRFGTFVIKVAKAKKGRNPNKPEHQVIIPERCVIRFRPGKELKASMNTLDTSKLLNGKVNHDHHNGA